MTTPEQYASSKHPAEIEIEQVIVLDWHDGPLEGFLKIADLNFTWYFQVVAEKKRSDTPDDRIYFLFEAPMNSVDRLTEILAEDEQVKEPLWVPSWRFRDPEIRQRADALVADLMNNVTEARIILRSSDLLHTEEIWAVTRRFPFNN